MTKRGESKEKRTKTWGSITKRDEGEVGHTRQTHVMTRHTVGRVSKSIMRCAHRSNRKVVQLTHFTNV